VKKLKILFDYSPAYKPNKTGIPIFVSELFDALEKKEDVEIEKTLNISKYIPREPHKLFRFFEQLLYHDLYLPFKLKFGNYDFYIENQYIFIPLFKPKNITVITVIHDIALNLFDNLHTKEHTSNWRKKLPISINNSDMILTVSKSSKHDIETYLHSINQTSKPVQFIYNDVDLPIFRDSDKEKILGKFNITTEYFLYLGTLEPRKNPLTLVKAFHLFKQNTQSNIKLVFAGKQGWLYDDVMLYISTHALENEIIFTGYISDREKVTLLEQTKAFLFLSLYEGFGIPVLEALKIGTPALVSDIPVFHELFQESVLYTPTNDITHISKQLQMVLQNPACIDTNMLEKFSWELSATKLIDILKKYSALKEKE